MIVISDATPIRYLVEIDETRILEKLFGHVTIPEKVAEELQHEKTPQRVREWMRSCPAWIEVRQADISLYIPKRKIEDGEREAIALALELKAGLLLVDDNGAINEAHRLNLPTLRLFTLLELAAKKNLLDLSQAVQKMRSTSFRLPPAELIADMLERDRQRNRLKS